MHEQRGHKDWHDERQVTQIVHKKRTWNDEEIALLARQEARLTIEGTRFINQALVPLFPSRTLESIKGQRKYQKYKDLVIQFIDQLTLHNIDVDPGEPPAQSMEETNTDLRTMIDSIQIPSDPSLENKFKTSTLKQILKSIKLRPVKDTLGDLDAYLLELFPPVQRPSHRKMRINQEREYTRRQIRRINYARTQRAWSKNPSYCLREILEEKTIKRVPDQRTMTAFWHTVMTNGVETTPGGMPSEPERKNISTIITPSEISQAWPEMRTAPGPDGLSAKRLRMIPKEILAGIFNIILWCGKVPHRLLESRTTLIPKKDQATLPEDFRPITIPSVLIRTLNKIIATRIAREVPFDSRQKAFMPIDGSAEGVFLMDMLLRHHRQTFKPFFMASLDLTKAFDSVTHSTVSDTLTFKGIPSTIKDYIMYGYQHSYTRISGEDWISEPIHPTCGVKQGDPLSPIIFNMLIDRMFELLPKEVGVDVAGVRHNAIAFADDLVFVASTPEGLQLILNTAHDYLSKCGLHINTNKSFSVALKNVPHVKKSVVDNTIRFSIEGRHLPAMRRTDQWKYLGIPFSPEGKSLAKPEQQLSQALSRLTAAPLKPQQRLFALRIYVLPSIYHQLTLGSTTLSRLKKIDTMIRGAIRKWLTLPKDVLNAYIHASVKDGGLSIPSMRWLMPLHRRIRLEKFQSRYGDSLLLTQEIAVTKRRLLDRGVDIKSKGAMERRWATILHASPDGLALKDSRKIYQQNQWIIDGTRFLGGGDFINLIKLRINALPTRSRTSRGRPKDRLCRAGCNQIETLNHIMQICERTHEVRIKRHNAVASYLQRSLQKNYQVYKEPHIQSANGLRKPDLVAINTNNEALVIDAQVIGEQSNLDEAHHRKSEYYKQIDADIKKHFNVSKITYTSATISCRGIWSSKSATHLRKLNVIRTGELKILSTRALVGGYAAFTRFNKSTFTTYRRHRGGGVPIVRRPVCSR